MGAGPTERDREKNQPKTNAGKRNKWSKGEINHPIQI